MEINTNLQICLLALLATVSLCFLNPEFSNLLTLPTENGSKSETLRQLTCFPDTYQSMSFTLFLIDFSESTVGFPGIVQTKTFIGMKEQFPVCETEFNQRKTPFFKLLTSILKNMQVGLKINSRFSSCLTLLKTTWRNNHFK